MLMQANLMVSASKEWAIERERVLSISLIPSAPIIFCSDKDVIHGKIERPFFLSRNLNGLQ